MNPLLDILLHVVYTNLKLKLDIPFIVELDKSKLDTTSVEFAKRKATNKKKHNLDKLKSVPSVIFITFSLNLNLPSFAQN